MGCPNCSQRKVPNEVGDEVEDDAETLSLCDLPLYGDEGEATKCYRSTASSEEEHGRESFEFLSRGELGSASAQRVEKTIFSGRVIQRGCPGKGNPKRDETATMHKPKRRWFFCWKLRLFGKSKTGYRKMKQRRRQHGTDSWGMMKGKWYFPVFGSAKFPVKMGLQDIKMRQSRQTNPSKMFGFSELTEAGIHGERALSRNSRGLFNILIRSRAD